MAQMEDELGEALPYWDWTEDAEIPDLWEGIRAPIKEGESSICGDRGQFVTRHDSIRLNATILKSSTKDALDEKDFIDFEKQGEKIVHKTGQLIEKMPVKVV